MRVVSVKENIMARRKWNAAALVMLLVSAAGAGAEAEAEGCTEELISFSACLPYVAYPPNNLTESASEKCCDALSSAVESVCLCYVVGDPLILGFPLNTTRLLSLSSLCLTSFPFICSTTESSPPLPPLNSAPSQTQIESESESESESGTSQSSNASILTPRIITFLFSQFLPILLITPHLYNSC